MGFLLDHAFLLLSLLLTAPAVLVTLLRRDLRSAQWHMALASLPFAATEWLFFPSYWEPRFLFDLARVFGFGLEDLLFVAALGAFATTAWPFAARHTLRSLDEEHPPSTEPTARSGLSASNGARLRRGVGWLGACFGLVASA